jgi:hypothetical protein
VEVSPEELEQVRVARKEIQRRDHLKTWFWMVLPSQAFLFVLNHGAWPHSERWLWYVLVRVMVGTALVAGNEFSRLNRRNAENLHLLERLNQPVIEERPPKPALLWRVDRFLSRRAAEAGPVLRS